MLNAGEAEGLKAAVLKPLEVGARLCSATVSCGSEMGQPGKLRVPTTSGAASWSNSEHIYLCEVHKDAHEHLESCVVGQFHWEP